MNVAREYRVKAELLHQQHRVTIDIGEVLVRACGEEGYGLIERYGDLYSMAASVYHLIAGEPPFEGDSMQGLVVAHISHQPPKLIDAVPSVPQAVSDLIFRFMQKDPDRRCANMDEAIKLIDAAIAS